MKLVGLTCLMLGVLLMGKSNADFKSFGACFSPCFGDCFSAGGMEDIFTCFPKCAWQCLPKIVALDHCRLGCALASCNNISTRQDPAGEKVGKCIDSCSGLCAQNYNLLH